MARYLKEEIRVTLTGKRDLTYTINVISHPFMIRWLETLKDNVIKNRVLEKNYCFLGFADSKRNLNFPLIMIFYRLSQTAQTEKKLG